MSYFEPRSGHLIVQKTSSTGVVSTEMWPVLFGQTSQDFYEHAIFAEHLRRERAARQYALAAMWWALLEVDNPALQVVLQLHAPDTEARSWLTCRHCGADEMDPGDWPCATVVAIAEWHSIEVPA